MAEDGLKALAVQLGGRAPGGLTALDSEHLRDLADAVHAVKRRQAAELAAAGDQALHHIPRLLRGPIRKMLG